MKVYSAVGLEGSDGGKVISEKASRDLMRDQIIQSIQFKSVKLQEIEQLKEKTKVSFEKNNKLNQICQ